MKSAVLGIVLGALTLSALVSATRPTRGGDASGGESRGAGLVDALRGAPDDGDFVVHEWGTFTSFSGSDGVRLEFRPLIDNDLPAFVLNRARQAGDPGLFLSKSRIIARQRMETPITYFYTDRVRTVNVRVDFPKGLLTEFYPPVAKMEPAHQPFTHTASHVVPAEGSSLDWGRVTLLPQSALAPALGDSQLAEAVAKRSFVALPPGGDPDPEMYTGDHYYFARDTDSAIVHVRSEFNAGSTDFAPYGDHFEKFLFYRGIGDFELPLVATAEEGGRFVISNRGTDPIRGLFLVSVADHQLKVRRLQDLAVGESLTAVAPETEMNFHDLGNAVAEVLRQEGLYAPEATAMVRTWQGSWFGEPGTRLFYLVPSRVTEELLPLTITPAPREMVRVLVGRMEILSREEERQLESIVKASAAALMKFRERPLQDGLSLLIGEPGVPGEIQALGRLAEPALVRMLYASKDREVQTEAARLIALLDAGAK
jgi:hypothetical protein